MAHVDRLPALRAEDYQPVSDAEDWREYPGEPDGRRPERLVVPLAVALALTALLALGLGITLAVRTNERNAARQDLRAAECRAEQAEADRDSLIGVARDLPPGVTLHFRVVCP